MPRVRLSDNSIKIVKKTHLKLVGLGSISLQRYKAAVSKFFAWRRNSRIHPSSSFGELDNQIGEYLDSLYQSDSPLHWAADLLSGMKRIYPRTRGFLKISDSYYRNWNKVIRRSRALPLSLRLVRGLFVYGCLKDNPEFSLVVLLGFVMLLRPGEILAQRSSLFTYVNEELMVVKVWGKQSARTGEWETVLLKDPLLIKVICNLKKKGKDFLFNKSSHFFNKLYKEALAYFSVVHPKLTPHGIRRGGATWHFGLYSLYDKTQEHGRWVQLSTARLYIDQATTATSEANLQEPGASRLVGAQALFFKKVTPIIRLLLTDRRCF